MTDHFHTKAEDGLVWWMPADPTIKAGPKTIALDWEAMRKFLGGWPEKVATRMMPTLECGCRVVMVVDEEGHMKQLRGNTDATAFYYPFAPGIVGDAFLIAEGPVSTLGHVATHDFFSLPPEFNEWRGPGYPIPKAKLTT